MKNKKGISAIVATVLIILITVAAVTILWMTIIPMVSDQLKEGTVCVDAISEITIEDDGYTCYNSTSNQSRVRVGYGSKDVDLAGIQVLLSRDGDTINTTDVTNSTLLPGVNEERVLRINYPAAMGNPDSVKIAAIVNVGNSQVHCEPSTPVVLREC